ncbi:MAG: hypothetical protein HY973_02840 [Candidatus Kerfeldbacteria bacterium]|nr:hypothetical protein [Candidatus Kerfeldbacteria bacterium]
MKIISDVYCKGNLFVFPGFHLYLENHAWSYFWRCAEYASFFRQYLTSEEYLRLGTYLPKTALVQVSDTDNELLTVNWDDGTKVNCLGEIPEHYVVKRGDSTGADNLFILSDHSRNPRQRAYNYALHSIKDGIIIQQLINDTKEQYPVVAEGSDHVELVQAHMKYSAFYVNGQYIGGNAMLCPKSRKVHGGSGTYIVPLYTIH